MFLIETDLHNFPPPFPPSQLHSLKVTPTLKVRASFSLLSLTCASTYVYIHVHMYMYRQMYVYVHAQIYINTTYIVVESCHGS